MSPSWIFKFLTCETISFVQCSAFLTTWHQLFWDHIYVSVRHSHVCICLSGSVPHLSVEAVNNVQMTCLVLVRIEREGADTAVRRLRLFYQNFFLFFFMLMFFLVYCLCCLPLQGGLVCGLFCVSALLLPFPIVKRKKWKDATHALKTKLAGPGNF